MEDGGVGGGGEVGVVDSSNVDSLLLRRGEKKSDRNVKEVSAVSKLQHRKEEEVGRLLLPTGGSAALPVATDPQWEEREASAARAFLEDRVRAIKKTGVIMETDATALELTRLLRDATRRLLLLRYGEASANYRVELQLEFQPSIPDYTTKGKDGTLIIEMAPISLLPCSVYNFLEIARTWKSGAFHRNARHVLQALARSDIKDSMPFQEYSPEYPHTKGTVGYCGRPSGPGFYVSIQDNTKNHGPGSQQKRNPYEADSIIGTVVQGMEDGTVDRIHTMPGHDFLSNNEDWVLIKTMRILIPTKGDNGQEDGYVEFSKSP